MNKLIEVEEMRTFKDKEQMVGTSTFGNARQMRRGGVVTCLFVVFID